MLKFKQENKQKKKKFIKKLLHLTMKKYFSLKFAY